MTPFESLPSPSPAASQARRWLRGLEVIRSLAAHASNEEAAFALGISEANLRVELDQLQSSLRVQLFRIDDGHVELTPEGIGFAPVADAMLELRDRFLAGLEHSAPATQQINLGACTTAGNYVLPVLLRTFRNVFPEVTVKMQIADSASILADLKLGKYDFGIVGSMQSDPLLQYAPFIDDEIVVIAPPGHPLMSKPEVNVSELGMYPWVVREAGSATRASLEVLLGQQFLGLRVWVGLVLESTEAIKLAVRVGDGIAFVSRRAVENELALGQLEARPLPGSGLLREFALVRRRDHANAFCAIELWKHLLASARDHGLNRPR